MRVEMTPLEGERLLGAFVWSDTFERRERLHAACAARQDLPELLRGDHHGTWLDWGGR
jgi:hypothetical protein